MCSNQVIDVLDALCRKFGIAIDWTSKNVQPYLKELMTKAVNYKFSIDIVWMCVAGLLLIAGVVFLTIALKSKKTHQCWDNWECSFVAISVCCLIAIIIICCITIPEIIACKTFPEKVILDMLQHYK